MNIWSKVLGIAFATLIAIPVKTALAADGCKVVLCLAGNWRNISECRPDVEDALRDIARGRGWPTCGSVGTQRIAQNTRQNCPPQYLTEIEGHNGIPIYQCAYTGINTTTYQGRTFSQTYWNLRGDTVTQWSDEAKAMFDSVGMLDQLDLTFELDYDEWLVQEEKKRKELEERDRNGFGGA